jgi:hypothetical protein
MTSFQGLAGPSAPIAIDGSRLVSRTIMAYLGGGAIEQEGFTSLAAEELDRG